MDPDSLLPGWEALDNKHELAFLRATVGFDQRPKICGKTPWNQRPPGAEKDKEPQEPQGILPDPGFQYRSSIDPSSPIMFGWQLKMVCHEARHQMFSPEQSRPCLWATVPRRFDAAKTSDQFASKSVGSKKMKKYEENIKEL